MTQVDDADDSCSGGGSGGGGGGSDVDDGGGGNALHSRFRVDGISGVLQKRLSSGEFWLPCFLTSW